MKELIGQGFTGEKKEVVAEINKVAKNYKFAVSVQNSDARKINIKCVHGQRNRNNHDVSKETRQRNRTTKQIGCNWRMYVKWNRDKQHWEVKTVSNEDEHNHPLDKAPIFYHQHRKITTPVKQQITSMSSNAIKPQKIFQELINHDDEPIMKKKDLYNFRAMIYEEDKHGRFSRIFEYLIDNNYVTRYKPNATKTKLDALFMTHGASIPKARRFNEIIVLDATYKTNKNDMPLLNVVGISHLGSSKLQNVLIASAFIINEKEESYNWVPKTMRNII